MPERTNTRLAVARRNVAGGILAAITALLLVYVIAAPAFAQSPGASGSPAASATARASVAASPGGQVPTASPTGLPDTATGDPGTTTTGGGAPIGILLLGIGAVAAVLVYMGMRGSQVSHQPAGSDKNPPA